MPHDPANRFHAEVRDDLVSLNGEGLGVDFHKSGDHWTEAIGALARSQPLEAGDRARIAHPVYQEIHLHSAEDGPSLCALLTGLCFDHHFSAAVTLDRDPEASESVRLDFDVADRCRSTIESLAATYLVGVTSSALEAADSRVIRWRVETPTPGRLELLAGEGAALALAEAGRAATRVQILATIQPGTFTQRLRYRWRWTSDSGLTR